MSLLFGSTRFPGFPIRALICVLVFQLYSVNYPSLHDNNTLRRVLVSEVLYRAEQLKNRWIQEKSGERNDDFTRCQTEDGGEMARRKTGM